MTYVLISPDMKNFPMDFRTLINEKLIHSDVYIQSKLQTIRCVLMMMMLLLVYIVLGAEC